MISKTTQPERRLSERRRVCLGGALRLAAFMPEVACRLRDLSLTGARIVLDADARLPRCVDLSVACRGETLRARVVWRNGSQAGLAFLDGGDAEPHPEPAPAVAAPPPSSRLH